MAIGADWKKASKEFQKELLSRSGEYSTQAARIFTNAAENFLVSVESYGRMAVPYYTGNLLDSIGVRILNRNTIVAIRTMVDTTFVQHATKPQHMRGLYPIWGEQEINKRITRPSRRTARGVVAQLMVGVPYAEEVDRTHNYFQSLQEMFESRMMAGMAALGAYKSYGYRPNLELL